ncbi:MAG: hypothetical protein INH41_27390 [Myxococcaceae bacterium]|jgi:hypothetical protein|nr:hypothetical protein [Myxococcaceae bacterium]
MSRTRRTIEVSDALWEALELMSRELCTDRDALVNQALFTFARFNGYVTPGSVAPHANPAVVPPAASAVPPVAQPLASPPTAVRHAEAPPPEVQAAALAVELPLGAASDDREPASGGGPRPGARPAPPHPTGGGNGAA